MEFKVIRHQNNIEVKNYSKVLTTAEEINSVKNSIFLYLSIKKLDIITRGLPYEELTEGEFRGFVSDMFQVIVSENYIDITDGDTNIQIQFSSSCETTTHSFAA